MQHQKLNIKISYLNNETPILQMFGIANACSVCVKMLLGSELRIRRVFTGFKYQNGTILYNSKGVKVILFL